MKSLLKFSLALVLAIAVSVINPLVHQGAIAAAVTLNSVSPVQIAYEGNALERRTKATADQVGGRIQQEYGDAVDSPGNQLEGRARRLKGNSANRAEDLGDKVRSTTDDLQDEGENLVDRVKDFFSNDDNNAQINNRDANAYR